MKVRQTKSGYSLQLSDKEALDLSMFCELIQYKELPPHLEKYKSILFDIHCAIPF